MKDGNHGLGISLSDIDFGPMPEAVKKTMTIVDADGSQREVSRYEIEMMYQEYLRTPLADLAHTI